MDDKVNHMILTCCIRSLVNLMQQMFFATTPITNFNLFQPRCPNDNKQVSIIHVIAYCCYFLCFQKFSYFEMLSFDLGHWVEPTSTTQFSRFLLIKFDKTSVRKKLYARNQIVLYCKNTKDHHSKARHQMGVVFLMCMVPLMVFKFQLLNLFHTLKTNMITKHVGIMQLHKVVVHCNIRFTFFFVSFQRM